MSTHKLAWVMFLYEEHCHPLVVSERGSKYFAKAESRHPDRSHACSTLNRSCLLLLGGCVPAAIRWQAAAADPQHNPSAVPPPRAYCRSTIEFWRLLWSSAPWIWQFPTTPKCFKRARPAMRWEDLRWAAGSPLTRMGLRYGLDNGSLVACANGQQHRLPLHCAHSI